MELRGKDRKVDRCHALGGRRKGASVMLSCLCLSISYLLIVITGLVLWRLDYVNIFSSYFVGHWHVPAQVRAAQAGVEKARPFSDELLSMIKGLVKKLKGFLDSMKSFLGLLPWNSDRLRHYFWDSYGSIGSRFAGGQWIKNQLTTNQVSLPTIL